MRGMARRSLVIWSWVVLALLAAHDVTHLLGASVVIGFAVIHALPASPASFFKLDPSLVSWALAVTAAAAALVLTVLAA